MEQAGQIIGQPVHSMYIINDKWGTHMATATGLYEYALRHYGQFISEIDDITNPIDCISYIDRQSEGEVDIEFWCYEHLPIRTVNHKEIR